MNSVRATEPCRELRVMIVEDERIIALAMRRMLMSMGCEVCGEASSGEEAVAVALKEKPDLVLMDIMLDGDMDGVEAARRIQAKQGASVAFATAYTDDATRRRAMDIRPIAFLAKPVDPRELDKLISSLPHHGRGGHF